MTDELCDDLLVENQRLKAEIERLRNKATIKEAFVTALAERDAEIERLRETLRSIHAMAEAELNGFLPVHGASNMFQIEADARAALEESSDE